MNKNQFIRRGGFAVLVALLLEFGPLPSRAQAVPSSAATSDPAAQVQYQNQVYDSLFRTPIDFCGKVVDADGNPVAGAKVSISAADHKDGGDSAYERTTDNAGLFSISTHGMGLVINVTKEGYYKTESSGGTFGYTEVGGETNRHPDPKNPAVFVLKKSGPAEALITIHRDVKTLKDGTPVQMNLTSGHTFNVTDGDIQVETWTHDEGIPPNGNHPYDWRCKITVLGGGGLQPRKGEFDFVAPTDGYQKDDTIDMPASAAQWRKQMAREYFLKLANGDYARISFTMRAVGAHFFSITSYINPLPGHRNLESNPDSTVSK
jgi:hypothetical protein